MGSGQTAAAAAEGGEQKDYRHHYVHGEQDVQMIVRLRGSSRDGMEGRRKKEKNMSSKNYQELKKKKKKKPSRNNL